MLFSKDFVLFVKKIGLFIENKPKPIRTQIHSFIERHTRIGTTTPTGTIRPVPSGGPWTLWIRIAHFTYSLYPREHRYHVDCNNGCCVLRETIHKGRPRLVRAFLFLSSQLEEPASCTASPRAAAAASASPQASAASASSSQPDAVRQQSRVAA